MVVGIVNTYMQTILSGARFEKDQVTRQQLVFINLRADRGLFFGFSGSWQIETIAHRHNHKSRTVHRAASCHHNDTACHASFVAGRSNRQ